MSIDVLAFGAHPDDLELGCGGTIAKLVQQGYRVVLCELTRGEMGTRGSKAIRTREAKLAAEILGVVDRRNLELPDGNIEVSRKNILKLVTLIRELRPSLLLIPYGIERHPDHIHTHQLCKEAWYYSGLEKLKTKAHGIEQKRHRPHHYFEYLQWYEFEPSFIVDISDTFKIKMDAIRSHSSQFYNPKSKEPETKLSKPEFLAIIETRCRYYGSKIGVQYGEPIMSPFALGIENIFNIKIIQG